MHCKINFDPKTEKQKFCCKTCVAKHCQKTNAFHWDSLDYLQKLERLKKSFEKKVIKQEGCWDWKGACQKSGYITIRFNVGKIGGHRASWLIYKGEVPVGLQVNHHCDNRRCTNPEHLYVGTRKQNDQDKVTRNRQAKGSKNGSSKLTEQQVEKILQLIKSGKTDTKIANDFNVSPACIWWIKSGQSWYLYLNEPQVAKEFAAHTPKGKKLPKKVKKK